MNKPQSQSTRVRNGFGRKCVFSEERGIARVAGYDGFGKRSSGKLELKENLALVKASLLYADRVRLCSVGSSLLSSIAQFAEAPEKEATIVRLDRSSSVP